MILLAFMMSKPVPSGSIRKCIRDLSLFSWKSKWNNPDFGKKLECFFALILNIFMTEFTLITLSSIHQISQRPPPAHAQAHPAHAQAHAHEKPPPPLYPPFDELVDTFGGGLVIDVMLEVNSLTFPTTLLEKFCTPITIEEAKSVPGTLVMPPPVDIVAPPGLGAIFPKEGS